MSMALKVAKQRSMGMSGGPLSGAAYQGDPGLFGFLGKAVGGLAKFAGKVLPGPVGLAAGGVGGLIAGGSRTPGISGSAKVPSFGPGFTLPVPGPTSLRVNPLAALPGGAPFTQRVGDQQIKGGCPSGFHPNKTSYFLKDGTFIPEGSKCVKNRRRNPNNPRALSKAIGRIESAKKAQERTARITIRCKRCNKSRCSCR